MRRIYLDANILVAYYASDNGERERRDLVVNAISVFSSLRNIALSVSMWTITEMVKTLINEKGMDRRNVAGIANDLIRDSKIDGLRIQFVDVHPQKRYRFNDFFHDVREKMILYNPGWGDAMHAVVMKNNGIEEILTFDEGGDFKIMPGITVIHPKDLRRPVKPVLVIEPS